MTSPQPSSTSLQHVRNTRPVDDLVDTKTAAKILGLWNHHTLEVWRSTKRYPQLCYHRVGRAIRYRVADLDAFLAASLVGSRGEAYRSTERVNRGDADARR